jgi:sterol desaturase/sphingolipid hydroxylase (fatty acid hydroxylase superfamily)
MLENLWTISQNVFYLFSTSLTSAYFICLCSNTPFYNPSLSSTKLVNSLLDSSFNLGIIGLEVITTAVLYYPYMTLEKHTFYQSISNIIEYSIWIELFYYIYHRSLHNSNWYLLVHAKHHSNIDVYPLDTLNIDILDSTCMILTLIAPLLFVQVNLVEYNIIIYLYLTGAFLTHSRLLVSRHVEHHKKFKCNFCFLFPIFDFLFGTLSK